MSRLEQHQIRAHPAADERLAGLPGASVAAGIASARHIARIARTPLRLLPDGGSLRLPPRPALSGLAGDAMAPTAPPTWGAGPAIAGDGTAWTGGAAVPAPDAEPAFADDETAWTSGPAVPAPDAPSASPRGDAPAAAHAGEPGASAPAPMGDEPPLTRPPGLSDTAVRILFGEAAVNAPVAKPRTPPVSEPRPAAPARRNLVLRPAVLIEGPDRRPPVGPGDHSGSPPDVAGDDSSATPTTDAPAYDDPASAAKPPANPARGAESAAAAVLGANPIAVPTPDPPARHDHAGSVAPAAAGAAHGFEPTAPAHAASRSVSTVPDVPSAPGHPGSDPTLAVAASSPAGRAARPLPEPQAAAQADVQVHASPAVAPSDGGVSAAAEPTPAATGHAERTARGVSATAQPTSSAAGHAERAARGDVLRDHAAVAVPASAGSSPTTRAAVRGVRPPEPPSTAAVTRPAPLAWRSGTHDAAATPVRAALHRPDGQPRAAAARAALELPADIPADPPPTPGILARAFSAVQGLLRPEPAPALPAAASRRGAAKHAPVLVAPLSATAGMTRAATGQTGRPIDESGGITPWDGFGARVAPQEGDGLAAALAAAAGTGSAPGAFDGSPATHDSAAPLAGPDRTASAHDAAAPLAGPDRTASAHDAAAASSGPDGRASARGTTGPVPRVEASSDPAPGTPDGLPSVFSAGRASVAPGERTSTRRLRAVPDPTAARPDGIASARGADVGIDAAAAVTGGRSAASSAGALASAGDMTAPPPAVGAAFGRAGGTPDERSSPGGAGFDPALAAPLALTAEAQVRTVMFPVPADEVATSLPDGGVAPPASAPDQLLDAAAPTQPFGADAAQRTPDHDELYEHLLDRLRRDLRAERERLGALIPELPE